MKVWIAVFLLCLVPVLALAQTAADKPRVALLDFGVSSDNPAFKYLGKGLSEMLAGELSRSGLISVIDREKRALVLGELEFSFEASSEEKTQKLGRLLTASYLLSGEVVDMAGSILLTCKLISVETGAIVWMGQSSGSLAQYELIVAEIARALMSQDALGLGKDALKAAAKPAAKPALPFVSSLKERAISAYSAAIDALDKKDYPRASREISSAALADPTNREVSRLFEKIVAPSPRYQSDVEFYAPLLSGANAALADRGSIGIWNGYGFSNLYSGILSASDIWFSNRLILSLPLGREGGLIAEAFLDSRGAIITSEQQLLFDGTSSLNALGLYEVNNSLVASCGRLGLGYRLGGTLALGASVLAAGVEPVASSTRNADGTSSTLIASEYEKLNLGTSLGASLSLSYRHPESTIFASFQVSWVNMPNIYLSMAPDAQVGSLHVGLMPLLVEAHVTGRFPGSRVFGSLRASLEQELDERASSIYRGQPLLEIWVSDWLSLRLGGEYGLRHHLGVIDGSLGANLGFSLALGKFELNASAQAGNRTVRMLPDAGISLDDLTFSYLLGLSWKDLGRRPKD